MVHRHGYPTYAVAFLLLVAASAAAAQTPVAPSTPAPAAEPAPAPAEFCNLACQIAKSPLPPGGGGGIATAKDIFKPDAGFDSPELGVRRPDADVLMQTQPY